MYIRFCFIENIMKFKITKYWLIKTFLYEFTRNNIIKILLEIIRNNIEITINILCKSVKCVILFDHHWICKNIHKIVFNVRVHETNLHFI